MSSTVKDYDHLEREIDAFMEQLPFMLAEHNGKWTVFSKGKSLGFWSSIDEAVHSEPVRKAREEVGNKTFLVRPVSEDYKNYGRYGKPRIITYTYEKIGNSYYRRTVH